MKLLNVSFLLMLLSCVFLANPASAGEKVTNEKPSSQAKQTSDPNTKTASPNSQTLPPEIKSRSAVNEPATNREKADSKKPANETGYFDFLWATQIPNWITIIGWLGAFGVAWWSLRAVRKQADLTEKSIALAERGLRAVERPWLSVTLEPKYTPKPDPMQTMATIFASESQQQLISTPKIDQSIIAEVNQGKRLMMIYGWVIYDDVFEERHVTRFYQVYSPRLRNFIFPRDADPRYNEAT